jgi:transposase-like protein
MIMHKPKKNHSAGFKAKIALEAIRERQSMSQIASEHGVHGARISEWKKQVMERLVEIFETPADKKQQEQEQLIEKLYQQIGQLQVELDWLKKKHESIY